jgi:hypothetical protein
MNTVLASFWVYFLLWIGFKTSAMYEYAKLFSWFNLISRITKIKEYEEVLKGDYSLSYSSYIRSVYPNFFVKMFSCHFCIGAWLSLCSSIAFGILIELPLVYCFSLLLFFGFDWIIKKITT